MMANTIPRIYLGIKLSQFVNISPISMFQWWTMQYQEFIFVSISICYVTLDLVMLSFVSCQYFRIQLKNFCWKHYSFFHIALISTPLPKILKSLESNKISFSWKRSLFIINTLTLHPRDSRMPYGGSSHHRVSYIISK